MNRYEDLPPVNGAPKPLRYRQTFLSRVNLCPRSALLYLKHEGGVPSHPMYRGRVWHRTAELAVKAMVDNGEVTIDPVDVKTIMAEVIAQEPEWIVPSSDMDALRVMCQHFGEHFTLPSRDVLVEWPLIFERGTDAISGTLDLCWVDGDTLHIRDWKAGWNLYPQDDVSGKDTLTGKARGAKAAQLIIYALLAADGHHEDSGWRLPNGVNHFDCRFVFPLFATDDGLAQRGVVIDRPDLIEHRQWLAGLTGRVNHAFHTGRWQPVPGTHCSTCPAPRECPIPAHLRQIEGVSPFERDPSELAEEYKFMQADADRLRDELKEYSKQYGPIPVGSDQELGFAQIESSRTDPKAKARLEAGERVEASELFKRTVGTRFALRKRS